MSRPSEVDQLQHELPTEPEGAAPEECESCCYAGSELVWYRPSNSATRVYPDGMWLCSLCANTMAGCALEYGLERSNNDLIETICYVGNAILARLGTRHE